MTLKAFIAKKQKGTVPQTVPLMAIAEANFKKWRAGCPARTKTWLRASGFQAKPGTTSLMAGRNGELERVFIGIPNSVKPSSGSQSAIDDGALWAFASASASLPKGSYSLSGPVSKTLAAQAALGWALGSYRFDRYVTKAKSGARLVFPEKADQKLVENAALATFLVRDLINTPAGDMGPPDLAAAARTLAREFGAKVSVTTGAQLLKKNYPAIHAVGRASDKAPRLIDLNWRRGNHKKLPRVSICGKGVCFDTGGLDLKSSAGMKMMKKDMGGAAQALGLARMIMAAKLPVQLRVLIPAVENSVSGNAYHPMDVIKTRKGTMVEVGNTDAEGRIVLADALDAACTDSPDLLIDLATLTGAARVALGTGIGALFCNDDQLAEDTLAAGMATQDPLWRLPLWQPYREKLSSAIADINNISPGGYGGAITAALFLETFVAKDTPWIHLDFMGWNDKDRPGRSEGGEAQGMRALFAMIVKRFGS